MWEDVTESHRGRHAAIVIAVALLLCLVGAIAWGVMGDADNGFLDGGNPYARLIDDFDPVLNKRDVSILNISDEDLVARMSLTEFMQVSKMGSGLPMTSLTDQSYTAYPSDESDMAYDVDSFAWSWAGINGEPFNEFWEWLPASEKGANAMITYADWMTSGQPADRWVLASDGYFYYSSILQPNQETALLLSGVAPTHEFDDTLTYYYVINKTTEVLTLDEADIWRVGGIPDYPEAPPMGPASPDGWQVIARLLPL